MSLIEIIKNNRSHLTQQSVKTYVWIIKNIGKKINIEINTPYDVYHNIDVIIDSLKLIESKKRKTLYAALLVLCDTVENRNDMIIDLLRKHMMADINEFKKTEFDQKKTQKQTDNWKDWEEITQKYNLFSQMVEPLFFKKELTKKEFYNMNLYVLLSCLILIPPLRSLNFTEFKINNVDKTKDNYMDQTKNLFVFNVYKGWNKKGVGVIPITKKLRDIIMNWKKYNTNDYMLLDTNKNKLTQTKLNNLLNNFFDWNISTSMLRHIYLTNKFNDVNLKEIKEVANNMQHSIMQDLKYVVR